MFSQLTKKVEDGILEYVGKRQANSLLNNVVPEEKKSSTNYFEQIKNKLLNDPSNENTSTITQQIKDRLGIRSSSQAPNEKELGRERLPQQEQESDIIIKAKKYAAEVSGQFNKLINREQKQTQEKPNNQQRVQQQIQQAIPQAHQATKEHFNNRSQSRENSFHRYPTTTTNQNGWIISDDTQAQPPSISQQQPRSNPPPLQQQEQQPQQQQSRQQQQQLQQFQQNQQNNQQQSKEQPSLPQKATVPASPAPSQLIVRSSNKRIFHNKYDSSVIIDDPPQRFQASSSSNNSVTYEQQQQSFHRSSNLPPPRQLRLEATQQSFEEPPPMKQLSNSFRRDTANPRNQSHIFKQQQQQHDVSNLSNREGYSLDNSYVQQVNRSGINTSRSRIFAQQDSEESILNSQNSRISCLPLESLDKVYFAIQSNENEGILQYELDLNVPLTSHLKSDSEKRMVYLKSLDSLVGRLEQLSSYQEQVNELVAENACANTHTLYMGCELVKVIACVTDDTHSKVQRARMKLMNFKMLYVARLSKIAKLSRLKKRLEYTNNFLGKVAVKYSGLIKALQRSHLNSDRLKHLTGDLEIISGEIKQLSSSQESVKVLKCLANAKSSLESKTRSISTYLESVIIDELLGAVSIDDRYSEKYSQTLNAIAIIDNHFSSFIPQFLKVMK